MHAVGDFLPTFGKRELGDDTFMPSRCYDVRHAAASRAPHAVIHVGPPKTGSTHLQAFFAQCDYAGDGDIFIAELFKYWST